MAALRSFLPIFAFAAIYAIISLLITNSYYQLMMTLVLVWACFGLSWNILSGYTGLISFGHAVFFGIGAYSTALGQMYFDLSPWISFPSPHVWAGSPRYSSAIRRSGCAATILHWPCSPTRSPCSTYSCGSAIRSSQFR